MFWPWAEPTQRELSVGGIISSLNTYHPSLSIYGGVFGAMATKAV